MQLRSLLFCHALFCLAALTIGIPGCATTNGTSRAFPGAGGDETMFARQSPASSDHAPVVRSPDSTGSVTSVSLNEQAETGLPPLPDSNPAVVSNGEATSPWLPPSPDEQASLAAYLAPSESPITPSVVIPPSDAEIRADLSQRPAADLSVGGMNPILRNRILGLDGSGDDDGFDYPDIHSDPGQRYHEQYGVELDYDRFLLPSIVNLIYEDRWLLAEKDPAKALKNQLQRRMKVDIRDPDPDTANFPNGAYTLPKGRMYIENSPLGLYAASRNGNQPRVYQWEYLIRYGLTDNLEFRIFSNGITDQAGIGSQPAILGYSPLAFDFKANFWEENTKYHIPAMGVEIYLETNLLGSSAFNTGTQPSINLLFDQSLPYGVGFEYNLGITGAQNSLGEIAYQFSYQWSFQREVVKDFDLFIHGFYNAAALPRLGRFQNASNASIPSDTVMGFGGIWTVNNRLSVFGSYNFGLSANAPMTIALLGFAVAM